MSILVKQLFKTTHSYLNMMVNEYLAQDIFPKGMTCGFIVLLFWKRDCSRMMNWRPITLLNTTYKIFAKVLQRRLQPLLVEVINSDQIAFFAFWLILDKILLVHKSIQWAKELHR